VAEAELGLDEVVGLHALEEFGGVLADASEDVEGGTGGVALDIEFGLDRAGEDGIGDCENDGGTFGWFGKVEFEQRLEVVAYDACPKGKYMSATRARDMGSSIMRPVREHDIRRG
jgi:hypothetical protein